jgi:hypothetical protein
MTHSLLYRQLLTKMGYYNYQNGLIYRHLNQDGGWETHLQNCRRFILKTLDSCKPEKVTVFGSGWLLDLPIAELVERTKKICLVDIIHPPDVLKQVADFKNVELIEQDVTGGLIAEVWQKSSKYFFFNKMRSLKEIKIPEYKPSDDPGMVISLNILTQLEYLLILYLKKKAKIPENEFDLFRSEIQKKHIDFLMKHRCVLITDYADVITSRSGSITAVPTLLTELPGYQYKEEWMWNFDHTGADLYNTRSQFKVVALTI